MMFRFESPIYLWLLLLIPILVIVNIYHARKKKKRYKAFGTPELLKQLSPGVSRYRSIVKFSLIEIALALAIIILARPQTISPTSPEKREGIEAIIAIDISNSMLAQDVAPSRLDKSKLMIENLITRFTDDRIGLIVFAGDAFVQLPITSDYVSAKMFLDDIDPSLIETQGTDIGRALDLAMHSFAQDTKAGKAIILITDGEDHEGNAEEMARKAAGMGIKVFILGVGSPAGSPIPLGDGEYLKDNAGNTVMSRLNEDMCRKIAAAGNGTYIHVDNSDAAERELKAEIGKMQKGQFGTLTSTAFSEQFQAVAIILIILLIIEAIILEKKNSRLQNLQLFKRKK